MPPGRYRASTRFPGGTVANFFDWGTGHLAVPDVEYPSMYRRFLGNMQEPSRRMHPNGARMQSYARVAEEIGSEVILVPNLETSTPDDQAEWSRNFASMRCSSTAACGPCTGAPPTAMHP